MSIAHLDAFPLGDRMTFLRSIARALAVPALLATATALAAQTPAQNDSLIRAAARTSALPLARREQRDGLGFPRCWS